MLDKESNDAAQLSLQLQQYLCKYRSCSHIFVSLRVCAHVQREPPLEFEAREREERLREISIKLRTPSGLTKLEDEPAYKRNNINLEENTHSSQDDISHFSLSDKDDDIILNDNNSYLHDNVD